jgi:hypothetical protein
MKPALAVTLIAILVVVIVVFLPLGGESPTTDQSQTSSLQTTITQQSVESASSSATITSITSSTSGNASAPCLLLIPADAQIGGYANTTFNGNVVTYSNGTRAFFSFYSCPQPVRGGEESDSILYSVGDDSPFNAYSMLSIAVSNSTFIAAENGSEFILNGGGGVGGCDYGGLQNSYCTFDAFFFHYSNNDTLATCTGIYQRQVLAGIEVDIRTTGYFQNGAWTSEGFDLQNPIIHVMSAFEIMLYNSPQCE